MEDLQRRIALRKKARQKRARRNLLIFILIIAVVIGISFAACHRSDGDVEKKTTTVTDTLPQSGTDTDSPAELPESGSDSLPESE